MHVATVIPISKGIPFDVLTYYSNDNYIPGTLVSIPFGNKLIIGLVFDTTPLAETKALIKQSAFSLRKVKQALGHLPYFESVMKAVNTTSILTLSPVGSVAGDVIPNFLFEYMSGEKIADVLNNNKNGVNQFTEHTTIGKEEDRVDSYRRTIRQALANKKSVLFTCPTISKLEKWKQVLEKGIQKHVVILHSKTTKRNLRTFISTIKTSTVPVVIFATPGFFCIPRSDLGTVIAEDESSSLYKTQDRFATDLRVFIKHFCENENIELIWGDILPRIETLQRLGKSDLPRSYVPTKMHIVSTEYYRTVLPSEAIDLVRHAEKKKHKIFIYTNRKGLAPLSRCSDCGTLVDCPNCKLPMVLRNKIKEGQSVRSFLCTHCGETLQPEYLCTYCGSWNITPLSIGTESIRNEIISLVGADAVVTIDDDLTPDSKVIEKLVSEIQSKKFVVIIGTIKALPYIKGIKYAMLPYFDRMLSTPSPYTTENILRLIMELDDRSTDGIIAITRSSDFSFTQNLAQQKINDIISEELMLRKDLSYPPFGTVVKISMTVPEGYRDRVKDSIDEYFKQNNKDQEIVAMPARRISLGSMKILMVWILKVSNNFIEEEGFEMRDFLESFKFPYRIEQNPERF